MTSSLAIDASRMSASERTGTEWYSYEIVRALAALEDRPDFTLYTRPGHEVPTLPRTTVKTLRPSRLWTHAGLSRAMLTERPPALFVPSHVIPLIHPPASVVTIHDLGYLREPAAHPRRQRLMLDRTTRWNARTARRIIAISNQTRDDLEASYGVDPQKIRVVHHGVDHDRFSPGRSESTAEVLARYDITQPYLLFVSTVQPRKNVVRLVEAFESLDNDALQLVIAGKSGWLSESIERRISESPLAPNIRRVGHVPDDDLPALYSASTAYVFPSLFEGFGMTVLEAMAAGTPVVTSNTSSLSEVAGNAAILVDPYSVAAIASGIREACDSENNRALRQRGLERASEFTWERAAQQTMDVIREACDARR